MKERSEAEIRNLDTIDIGSIVAIDEKISGQYRPEVWETRVGYYLRRDPDAALVAVIDGQVVGFMLGEVRSGEFGLEEPTGWVEVLGVDPECQGRALGSKLAKRMLGLFAERGVQTVRTLVDGEMDDIAGFFTSLGFEPSSLRPFVKTL